MENYEKNATEFKKLSTKETIQVQYNNNVLFYNLPVTGTEKHR